MNNNEVGDEGAVYLAQVSLLISFIFFFLFLFFLEDFFLFFFTNFFFQALLKNRTLHTLSLWNNGLTYRAAEAFGTTLAQVHSSFICCLPIHLILVSLFVVGNNFFFTRYRKKKKFCGD